MTDTKESNYQDRADTLAENARLRAEVDFANERMHAAQNEVAKLRNELSEAAPTAWKVRQDLRNAICDVPTPFADMPRSDAFVKCREERSRVLALVDAMPVQQAEAAAPSDEAVAALERKILNAASLDHPIAAVSLHDLRDLFAMVKRAQRAAPAASGALREAAKELCKDAANAIVDYGEEHDLRDLTKSEAACRAALAAEPPAPSAAAGVAVPEDVRKSAEYWAQRIGTYTRPEEKHRRAYDCAKFILSLPTAAGASQPEPVAKGDRRCEVRPGLERVCELGTQDCQMLHTPLPGSDAELQRLLRDARSSCETWQKGDHGLMVLLKAVEAMAQRLGAR